MYCNLFKIWYYIYVRKIKKRKEEVNKMKQKLND